MTFNLGVLICVVLNSDFPYDKYMAQAAGYHHIRRRRKVRGEKDNAIDKFMYGVALIAPFMTIPQLIRVWSSDNIEGISLITWGGFACVSVMWFIYALKHNEKPLMLTHFLLFVLNVSIVVGVVFHH
jgi:uncharacterized protein with PQ loop repeat